MDNELTTFEKALANLFKARFPYVYISTWEEERVLSAIERVAKSESLVKTIRNVFVWKATTGLGGEGQQPSKEDTKNALKTFEFIEKYDGSAVFVLLDFHIHFGCQGRVADVQVIRKIRDTITLLKRSAKPKNVVFVCPTLVLPHDLQKDVTILDFDLPSSGEIKRVLDEMILVNRDSGRIQIDLKPGDAERLAKAAQGLTLQEAENAFARAMVETGRLDNKSVEVILEEKRQIIKKTGILEFIKSDLNMKDVGGLGNMKRWLKRRDKSWDDSAQKYCLPSPKGILITGVPGCGKSLTAKAISAMWQLPLLRLDIGKIFSGIVGSSEENMRSAIKTAEAIAPCILWIDEIEKGFSSTGTAGDSGTSSRVFGTFLTWMQEKVAPVFVAATANNIHALPAEMLRKGRFDEIFFVDLPTHRERVEILRVHLEKRLRDREVIGGFQIQENNLECLAQVTEGFVGAEIEHVVTSALFEAFSEDRSILLDDFLKAISQTVPLSITQAEQIRGIREWANVRAVAATSQDDRIEYVSQVNDVADDVRTTRGGRTIDF
ncbi:ATPase [Anaerosporomusa subterranea]|uniref:Uncharacterized AAA domain-containing protein ycf46 n=1 Tax=Anaerosporomusa subterranea TaxID=1794912 RepID=A0A154BQF1_ANASB|nr:AAA family ATPase [Anaerosporomusa subterranea]KYZ76187.1 ATPase [Anaerosporomusa subterranea]